MRITILTVGSRGDVQPFIALAIALQKAGHSVQLATHANFEAQSRSYGIDFALISGNPQEAIQSEAGQATLRSGNGLELSWRFGQIMNEMLPPVLLDSWKACQNADVLITSSVAFWGFDIAEALGIPCFVAALQPFNPTEAFPCTSTPPELGWLGGIYNRLSYAFVYRFVWQFVHDTVNHWRSTILNLPPVSRWDSFFDRLRWQRVHYLHAFSPAVIPRPRDWADNIHITGYWFLDAPSAFQPPSDLLDFLADGAPPVYIGFGSMAGRDPEETTAIALSALKQTGQRGILLTGWGGMTSTDLPDHVFKLDSIPHDWLFPQMACVVHHGGAGTTAATFRAGVPGVIIPYFADQPFWGDRAFKLGVSPAPIPRNQLTAESLTAAIETAMSTKSIQQRSRQLGETIRAENGISEAVHLIHKFL